MTSPIKNSPWLVPHLDPLTREFIFPDQSTIPRPGGSEAHHVLKSLGLSSVNLLRHGALAGPLWQPLLSAKASAPKAPSAQDWFKVLPAIGDAVLRADFDAYNLPFSRNVVGNPQASSRLLRSSEYKPKHGKYAGAYVEVHENIFGRAHGEVRPIQGQDESLITRVTLDYQGGEVKYHLPKFKNLPLGYLELDCFTAVTPPTMTFDFSQGSNSVRSIKKDGDLKYENACIKRKHGKDIVTTPWDSAAPPPPKTKEGTHPDWMFYFQPIESTLGQTIVRRYINRQHRNGKFMGGLYLWANNPAMGFTDPSHYDKLGIRYNTWPRRLGDMLRFFSPLFDAEQRTALKQGAPFLNPNTEYLDADGNRQKIPNDPLEVQKINESRKKLGLELIPRSRGPAVDWVFTDLFDDPKRMAATPKDRWPYMNFRIQFKPDTLLKLPVGDVRINPDTEVKITYRSSPITEDIDGKKRVRARTELVFDLGPLDLGKSELNFGGYQFKIGQHLRIEHLKVTLPFEQVYEADQKSWHLKPRFNAIQMKMTGLQGKGIRVLDKVREIEYGLDQFRLKELIFKHHRDWAQAQLTGLSGSGLAVHSTMGEMKLERASIPKMSMQARHDLQDLWIKIDKINASGKTHLEPNFGSQTRIDLDGSSTISGIYFRRFKSGEESTTMLNFMVRGELPRAKMSSPLWGEANLSMQEGETSHPLVGEFKAKVVGKNLDYHFNLDIPYTQFDVSTPVVVMPPGTSTLRNGVVQVTQDGLSFEGDLDLYAKEIRAPGTDVFRWKDFTVSPHIEDLRLKGSARLEYNPLGFHLKKPTAGKKPISAEFRLSNSSFSHAPHFSPAELKAHPELQVIQTQVDIEEARVLMSDIEEVQYVTEEEGGKTRGKVLRLETGPVLLHHIKGGGDIWVNTLLWSWLKGSFPSFGKPIDQLPKAQQTPKPKASKRPDVKALTKHFDGPTQKLLWDSELGDYSNFVRVGGISVGPDPDHPEDSHRSLSTFKDLVIYVHETGNRWQFAAVGIPQLGFVQQIIPGDKPRFQLFSSDEAVFTHIFLKDRQRGFNPFLLKSPKPYQAPTDSEEE